MTTQPHLIAPPVSAPADEIGGSDGATAANRPACSHIISGDSSTPGQSPLDCSTTRGGGGVGDPDPPGPNRPGGLTHPNDWLWRAGTLMHGTAADIAQLDQRHYPATHTRPGQQLPFPPATD